MENYDPRRQSADDRERSAQRGEDRGRDRESWRQHDEDRGRRHASDQTGWLDYDRDYGRSERERPRRDEQRYGQDRSSVSPDWSREGAEPRQSDPYYSRNRDRGEAGEQSRSAQPWQDDDRGRWEQRARSSIPREQHRHAERSRSGDYYSPDWPYERGRQGEGRDEQRSRQEDSEPYYEGYYSRSATPIRYPGGSGVVYSESLTLHGPYTGRGPKGYKRSEQQIVEEASQRLERNGEIDASEIEVTAEDGIITLRGTVGDRATKRRAEECVESVYGVRDVMNELRVSAQGREDSQGSERSRSQGSQRSRSARASQRSQASSSSQGSQTAGQAGQAPASRGTGGTTGAEQSSEGDRTPKH